MLVISDNHEHAGRQMLVISDNHKHYIYRILMQIIYDNHTHLELIFALPV